MFVKETLAGTGVTDGKEAIIILPWSNRGFCLVNRV